VKHHLKTAKSSLRGNPEAKQRKERRNGDKLLSETKEERYADKHA
jgi:hypothetical protein